MESFYYVLTKSGRSQYDSYKQWYKWGSDGFGTFNYDSLPAGTYELAIRGGPRTPKAKGVMPFAVVAYGAEKEITIKK